MDVVEIIGILAIIFMVMKGTIMCIYWVEHKGSMMIKKVIKDVHHSEAIQNTAVIDDVESNTAILTFDQIVYREGVPHVQIYTTEHGARFHSRQDCRGMRIAKKTLHRLQCRDCWPPINPVPTTIHNDTVHIE